MLAPVQRRTGEEEGHVVSRLAEAVDDDATRVAEVVELRDLVEGLSDGVVDRRAKDSDLIVAVDTADDCVATGDEDSEIGILERLFDLRGVEMGPDVVDADHGDAQRVGEGLGEVDAHEEGAEQAGPVGNGHSVEILLPYTCLVDGGLDDLGDPFRMESACKLGHHSLIGLVELYLGRDHVGQNLMTIPDKGRGALVTAGLNT